MELVSKCLETHDIPYVRFQGDLNRLEKAKAVKTFMKKSVLLYNDR